MIVFYWTPPHFFGGLSIRLVRDYAAAGVPMLPVVRGIPATNRKIMLYSVILVALTVAFIQVGSMGLIYTAAAVLLQAPGT